MGCIFFKISFFLFFTINLYHFIFCNIFFCNFDKEKFDLTFIDTWHVYGQLKRELTKFNKITNKYIIMHDTTIDGYLGESLRMGWDIFEQSSTTGMPIEEIKKGIWPAIEEFLFKNKYQGITEFLSKKADLEGNEVMLIYNKKLSTSCKQIIIK